MSDYTSKLNLYKVDPAIDGEDTFNINTMMNDNWDKIDEKVGNMDEKLSGVEDNANNYNHPDTHDANMIRIQDEGGKFTGDNVEDALGEVGSQLADIANKQGNLSTLQTTEKDNIVGALNEVFQDADNGKTAIYNAIIGKGITPNSQGFNDLVSAINVISTGKKSAQGSSYNISGHNYITVNNLSFNPSLVIIQSWGRRGISDNGIQRYGNGIQITSTSNIYKCVYGYGMDKFYDYNGIKGTQGTMTYDTSFNVINQSQISGNSFTYKSSISGSDYALSHTHWWAYE